MTPAATRRRTVARHFDHEAAFAFFAESTQRSQRAVAERFGVTEYAVYKVAKSENWYGRRDDLHRKAAERAVTKTLEQANRENLQLVDKARSYLLGDEAEAPKWSDMAPLMKMEQLIYGQATSRTDVPGTQVQAYAVEMMRGFFAVAVELYERGLSAREFRQELPRLLPDVVVRAGEKIPELETAAA